MRMYQTTPSPSRSRVIRSVTSSTVPTTVPVSMTSPTPYWSSTIMNSPERVSLTRLCAPKPMARPATPADASSGPRGIPNRSRIISSAVPMMMTLTVLLTIVAAVATRFSCRSLPYPVALASTPPTAPSRLKRFSCRSLALRT